MQPEHPQMRLSPDNGTSHQLESPLLFQVPLGVHCQWLTRTPICWLLWSPEPLLIPPVHVGASHLPSGQAVTVRKHRPHDKSSAPSFCPKAGRSRGE